MSTDASGGGGDIKKIIIGTVSKGVMGDLTAALDPGTGSPNDMENRDAMGFGTHHAVDGTEFADGVGGGEDGGSAAAGITIRSIGGVQFVRADHPRQLVRGFDRVIDREGVVARNAKGAVDAEIGEAADDIFNNG